MGYDHEKFWAKIFAAEIKSSENVRNGDIKLVHYTRASNATKIIANENVWLRNVACMNDFRELEYGKALLRNALHSDVGQEFRNTINEHDPQALDTLLGSVDEHLTAIDCDTYVMCLSEHDPCKDDDHGRLSMWRAYAREDGVALIVNTAPFTAQTDKLGIYSYKVNYHTNQDCKNWLSDILESWRQYQPNSSDEISEALNIIRHAFHAYILHAKHPAFWEEREWRIIKSPVLGDTPVAGLHVEEIGGVPQRVAKLPLKHDPDSGLHFADVNRLIYKILIGPSEYGQEIFLTLCKVLEEVGVTQPEKRLAYSDVPLRR